MTFVIVDLYENVGKHEDLRLSININTGGSSETTTKKQVVTSSKTGYSYLSALRHLPRVVCSEGKGKGTFRLVTGHEGQEEEQKYSSTLSLTSALDGSGCSTPRPGRFTAGKQTW